jgi:sugar phosphate isomerase/epimerase
MALHLHDNGGSCSQHQLPFDGSIDWSVVMTNITETRYSGATALEPMNWDYKDLSAAEFLYEAYKKAKKLEAFRFNIQ